MSVFTLINNASTLSNVMVVDNMPRKKVTQPIHAADLICLASHENV